MKKFLRQLRVAKTLLITDFKGFKPVILDKIIDMIIWVSISLWVSAYILPKMGIESDYGTFMLGALIASVGVFETFPTIFALIFDFERNKITHYYATLPLPTWMMFTRLIIYYACTSAFIAFLIIPLSMPILGSAKVLEHINWLQLLAIFVAGHLFYGAFALFIASWVKNSFNVDHMWTRVIYPLWFLGGYQFSWQSLYETAPWFATAGLLNPLLHITEGFRTAITGTDEILPFWISILFIITVTLVISWISIARLKKRLDFI